MGISQVQVSRMELASKAAVSSSGSTSNALASSRSVTDGEEDIKESAGDAVNAWHD